jgi:hypothetical protein
VFASARKKGGRDEKEEGNAAHEKVRG